MTLGQLRRILYRMGLRPARGSIFYSPSLHYAYVVEKAFKANAEEIQRRARERYESGSAAFSAGYRSIVEGVKRDRSIHDNSAQ